MLLAGHHIYICKLKETRPSLEMYKQLVYNTLQLKNKIAMLIAPCMFSKRNGPVLKT